MTAGVGFWLETMLASGLALGLVVIVSVYASVWIDSKLGADLQARVGPNQTGRAGVFQPIADFLRTLAKVRFAGLRSRITRLWWIQAAPLFGMLVVVPAGTRGPPLDAPMAIFIPIILGLCFAFAGLLIHWQAEEVEGRLASLRRGALVAAATPPVLMSIAAAGMTAGGFQWHHFNEYQGFLPIHWVAFSNPGALIAGLVYFCSGMLIFSLPPFSTARPQNASIFLGNSGAVGLQEAWGRLALRVAPICWNLMGAQIFLGGDRVPRAFLSALEPVPAVAGFLSLGLLMVKVILVQAVMTILGRTLPAVRSDQAHDFAWRALYPAAIIALVCIRVFGFGSWGEGL